VQRSAPLLAAVFTLVMFASIGVPGLNGFVGEFLILTGTFITHRWWAVVAVVGVILSAVYMLWGYQQVFHGRTELVAGEGGLAELTWREGLVMAPLAVLIVFLGVYPQPVLDRISPSVDRLVVHVEQVAHPHIPAIGQPLGAVLTARRGPARPTGTVAAPGSSARLSAAAGSVAHSGANR
jgi:NADH-quinone oxidoreductase subunit M